MITYSAELITPEIAADYLRANARNRTISNATVNSYANDMARGLWQESPEPISFYEDGALRDGQHRLSAIVASGVPVTMVVARGVPKESNVVDMQRPRTIRDLMKINGGRVELCDTQTIGAVRLLLKEYDWTFKRPSYGTITDFVSAYTAELLVAHEVAATRHGKPSCSAPIFASVICALMCGVDEHILKSWCDVVNTGFSMGLEETAAIVVRNYALANKNSNTALRSKIFDISCKGINDFAHGVGRTRVYGSNTPNPYFKTFCEKYLDPLYGGRS